MQAKPVIPEGQLTQIIVAQKLQECIEEIEKIRKALRPLARKKAEAEAMYAKQLAITIVGLKNGKKFMIDDVEIEYTNISSIEKVAKGICSECQLLADVAAHTYKAGVHNLNATRDILSAWQSINKHLSEV